MSKLTTEEKHELICDMSLQQFRLGRMYTSYLLVKGAINAKFVVAQMARYTPAEMEMLGMTKKTIEAMYRSS